MLDRLNRIIRSNDYLTKEEIIDYSFRDKKPITKFKLYSILDKNESNENFEEKNKEEYRYDSNYNENKKKKKKNMKKY